MLVFPPSAPFSKPGSLRCVRSRPLAVRAPRTPPPSRPALPAPRPPSLGSPCCAAPKLPCAAEASAPLRLCAALPHARPSPPWRGGCYASSGGIWSCSSEGCRKRYAAAIWGITFLPHGTVRSGDLFHLKPCPFFS